MCAMGQNTPPKAQAAPLQTEFPHSLEEFRDSAGVPRIVRSPSRCCISTFMSGVVVNSRSMRSVFLFQLSSQAAGRKHGLTVRGVNCISFVERFRSTLEPHSFL